jgi:hypothetical protein
MQLIYPPTDLIFHCEWFGVGLCNERQDGELSAFSPNIWRCFAYLVVKVRKTGAKHWEAYKSCAFAVKFSRRPAPLTSPLSHFMDDMLRRTTGIEVYSTHPKDLLIIVDDTKSPRALLQNALPNFSWGWKYFNDLDLD